MNSSLFSIESSNNPLSTQRNDSSNQSNHLHEQRSTTSSTQQGNTQQIHIDQSWSNFLLQFLILKRRNLREFRILLSLILTLNIFAIVANIITVSDIDRLSVAFEALAIVAIILAVLNALLILKLIIIPTTRTALSSCCLIIVLELVYIAEFIVFEIQADSSLVAFVLIILFIVFQLLTSIVLYRYWEFVYYSYDDSQSSNLSSFRSSLQDPFRSSNV